MILDELQTDFEKAQGLQNMLIAVATGGIGDDKDYKSLRTYFIDNKKTTSIAPSFIRVNRELDQFWQFIKFKFKHYSERREFIWNEFSPLMDLLESKDKKPSDLTITDGLKSFDEDGINVIWIKALERRKSDPEGAITMARTLMESVCKHILDSSNVVYDRDKTELPDLYKLTSKELNIAPSQHTTEVFKQIFGGVASVVNGLGALRNRLGDAHGKGKAQIRPAQRHAQLAVNLAGATALFLIETWQFKNNAG